MEVQPTEHHANGWIQGRAFCDGVVVFFLDGSIQGRIGPTYVTNVFGVKLALDTCFSKDINGLPVRRELKNARYVYRSAVGRAENFTLEEFAECMESLESHRERTAVAGIPIFMSFCL